MFGTVARLQVKPGKDAELKALHERWQGERGPEAVGFIADYALKSERVPGEWFVLAIFDNEDHYRRNAEDPEQHRQFEELCALLVADPEWNDGEVFAFEPTSVPV